MEKGEKDFSKQGKKNRNSGRIFETKVRENLEKMGWIVDKWTNTVDYDKLKLVPAKRKFNPFRKVMTIGTGFPDFIAFKRNEENNYDVVGVEVKSNGYIDQIEKSMCMWLLENKIFSKILIARKGAPKGVRDISGEISTGGTPQAYTKEVREPFQGTKEVRESLRDPDKSSAKISTGGKKRREIEYIDFREKHGKKFL